VGRVRTGLVRRSGIGLNVCSGIKVTRPSEDIVITGAGLITSLGLDRETTWKAVARGRCGVGPLTAVESPLDPDKGGGEVKDPDHRAVKDGPREVRFLRRALHEALRQAGMDGDLPCRPQRCALVLGTSLHGMRNGGAYLRSGDIKELLAFLAGATLSLTADGLPAAGLSTTTCSACSSGLASVALGHTLLQSGEADLVIAGGYDPISEYSYAGFNSMRLVSPTDLRPFARSRDGMKLAEGYAVVVLERAYDARSRGADPLAVIAGYGESCDAYHLSKPHPEGSGAAAAMHAALSMAGLSPDDIDMAVAHATATPDNDAAEHAALAQVFAGRLRDVPVVGFKSHLGHSLGAAGTVELILSALSIRDGLVPPCANVSAEDTEFDDMCVACGEAQVRKLRYVLNTSLGFGGANSCMIVGAPSAARYPAAASGAGAAREGDRDPVITGVGVVLPGAIGNDAFAQLLENGDTDTRELPSGAIPSQSYEHLINARRTRRMSEYAKLCLAATSEAYRDAGIDDAPLFGETAAAIVGTTHGPTEYCETYYRQILDEGVNAANPTLFAEGVPNVASAHLSTNFAIKGFCQTIIGTRTAGLEALQLATSRIRSGLWDRAIVATAEEATELIATAYAKLLAPGSGDGLPGRASGPLQIASGAVTLVLESRASAADRGARVRGTITHTGGVSWYGCPPAQRVFRLSDLLRRLEAIDALATSTNGTDTDRIEQAAIRAAYRNRAGVSAPASSALYGRTAETFSVGPLAALAAGLLCGRLPAPIGNERETANGRAVADVVRDFGVICTDYVLGACGVAVHLDQA